jgi:hypothetical protein
MPFIMPKFYPFSTTLTTSPPKVAHLPLIIKPNLLSYIEYSTTLTTSLQFVHHTLLSSFSLIFLGIFT